MATKTIVKDFVELAAPRLGDDSGRWVVFAEDDMFLVLLCKEHEIVYGPERKENEFEFETELQAYLSALRYYVNCDKAFPYLDELLAALDDAQKL